MNISKIDTICNSAIELIEAQPDYALPKIKHIVRRKAKRSSGYVNVYSETDYPHVVATGKVSKVRE